METKEIKIKVPDGYEIDKENSTFECIKFKPIIERWRDNTSVNIKGYYINSGNSKVWEAQAKNIENAKCIFATKKQAKSALAMAQISQIMANDKRFGGVFTDKEWKDNAIGKYTITRTMYGTIDTDCWMSCNYYFLTFHTREQRDLFLEENRDLVKDYLMID